MLNVTIENFRIRFGERLSVSFQRTLRIPEDGRIYPLPPSLGSFPIHRVVDYAERVPASWRKRGGAFIPMYQREALWLAFEGARWKPNAVKVGIGRVNAVSGKPWDEVLHGSPQDYLVCPDQPWLDGINAGTSFIRQFVAMPLGRGYTVEAQVSKKEEHGGIQILVFEPKPKWFPDAPPESDEEDQDEAYSLEMVQEIPDAVEEMGLGAGGKMEQKIYPDSYGLNVWDTEQQGSVFVHIANSTQYHQITGLEPPPTPISAKTYTDLGLPWIKLYDEAIGDVAASEELAGVRAIGEIARVKGEVAQDDVETLEVQSNQIKRLPLTSREED